MKNYWNNDIVVNICYFYVLINKKDIILDAFSFKNGKLLTSIMSSRVNRSRNVDNSKK